MLANYGYADGSGEFYITIDTGKCDGCGLCTRACPAAVFEVCPDENDPLRDEPVARVVDVQRKQLKYSCAPCKATPRGKDLPCVAACAACAISHSW